MKTSRILLPLIASLAIVACTISVPEKKSAMAYLQLQPVSVIGESIHPVVNDSLLGYLVTSEANGIIWLSRNAEPLSQIAGHTGQADWRFMPGNEHTLVIASIDNNTSALQLLTLDLSNGVFTSRFNLPSEIADRETVCLSRQGNEVYLFSSDARGVMSHFLVTMEPDWQLTPIRQLRVGPSMSSCSVTDDTNTLLIAEEETGVWHYSGDAEGEDARSLDYFPTGPEIESVSALADGRYFVAATDTPAVFERGDKQILWQLPANSEIKSINVAADSDTIYLGLYNEASGRILTGTLANHSARVPAKQHVYTLTADAQTTPVNRYGDAADDPAIWVNHHSPSQSLILGTDKKYGLNVYSLTGELLKSMPTGRVNNVDVRYQITMPDGKKDIAVASNRSFQTLSVYAIDSHADVTHLAELPTTLSDVYGLCSGVLDNHLHVFINDTNGTYQQYQLTFNEQGPSAVLISEFVLPSQPEGCVVDDHANILYMGEEAAGIWQKDLNSTLSEPRLIATTGGDVTADIEGMGIYTLDGQRYLIASSQGNNRYAVFALDDGNKLLGTFRVGINADQHIDGVSETDGLEVTSEALGSQFPEGLLVVQDGRNVMPSAPQNFKLINGSKLADFIRLKR